ncbi:MAG: OmpA family protein [Gammaproteobacteria bacterium]|nr:OmpA family protein [Gammaproteobacteria bacterium]MDH5802391.1 OmpA family protein [Gammaproteobacteria bacterium]
MAIVKRSGISYAVTLALLPAALIVGCAGNDKLTRLDSSELKTPEVVTDAVTNETVELQDNFAFVQIAPPLVGHGVNSEISVNDAELSVQEEPLAKMVAEQELVDVVLTPAEPEYPQQSIIRFAVDQYDIVDSDLDGLKQHALFLQNNPDMELNINGYADSRGSAQYNFQLSKKRADQIEAILLTLGASPTQLKVNSYGESFPVKDEKNWDENRRVELQYKEREQPVMAQY